MIDWRRAALNRERDLAVGPDSNHLRLGFWSLAPHAGHYPSTTLVLASLHTIRSTSCEDKSISFASYRRLQLRHRVYDLASPPCDSGAATSAASPQRPPTAA